MFTREVIRIYSGGGKSTPAFKFIKFDHLISRIYMMCAVLILPSLI